MGHGFECGHFGFALLRDESRPKRYLTQKYANATSPEGSFPLWLSFPVAFAFFCLFFWATFISEKREAKMAAFEPMPHSYQFFVAVYALFVCDSLTYSLTHLHLKL